MCFVVAFMRVIEISEFGGPDVLKVAERPDPVAGPGQALDQLDDATRDGLKLDPDTVAAIGEAEAHRNRWTTRGIWVIAILLLWVVLKAF